MDNKIELAIKCVYEMYKVDWMRRITPEQIINEAKCWFDSWIDCLEEAQTFSEWVEENGFGGELYVCFDEFCECELNDKDYIRNLIGDNDEMMEIIEQYWGAKMEIIVKDYSSNIEMFIYDNDENYVFNVYHDDCMYHPYDINLEAIIENISETLERKLTQEEELMIEEKIGTWLDAHSCEDDEYYDKEQEMMTCIQQIKILNCIFI